MVEGLKFVYGDRRNPVGLQVRPTRSTRCRFEWMKSESNLYYNTLTRRLRSIYKFYIPLYIWIGNVTYL